MKDLFKQDDLYKDRDGQLQAIEKTFEDAKSEITEHYSKKGVYPVASFPIYPDMKVIAQYNTHFIPDNTHSIPKSKQKHRIKNLRFVFSHKKYNEEILTFLTYRYVLLEVN